MARLLAAPNRGSYPRQFMANPYRRRATLRGLGQDAGADFAAAIDSPLPFSAAPAAPAPDPVASLNFAPGFGPNAPDASDQFAALTLQQDAAYLPTTSASPSTPTPPSNSSVDWTKLAATAGAGLVAAGANVAAASIKAKSAAQQAQAAQAAQLSAAARAAALAKAGLKSAGSSSGLLIIGGVAALGLILVLALRK